MKCARCGHDSKYSERSGRICPNCRLAFAFEPREGDKYTDMAFQAAIDRVSAKGTVKFLPDHVRFQLLRRGSNSAGAALAVGAIGSLLVVLGSVLTAQLWCVALVVPWVVAVLLVQRATVGGTLPGFDALWRRWVSVHGAPPGLVEVAARKLPGPSVELERELHSYSFDRAVICDRPATVDVLLANDFHFENNCAVLTIDGHPAPVFRTVRAMLRNNPRLEVFALHDATPEGCALAHRLRTDPEWFADGRAKVFDVALRPAQVDRGWSAQRWRSSRPAPAHPGYTEAERRWLSQWWLPLEVIPPEQLVKRLFRAMQHLPETAEGVADGSLVWVGDASASDGGGDSFG